MMAMSRLSLVELIVAGDSVSPATVTFAPGLNLIVGASDTGKTFIFEALDFMLGAKDGLRRIPESEGYDRAFLAIDPLNHSPFTLRRGIDGGQFEVTEYDDGRKAAPTATKVLSPKHSADADGSLSAYLLRAIGIEGRLVRKNEKGERRALSFRDVAHLTLIGEERIIQQTSPVVTGQYTQRTSERNVFAFFMTGQDDSQIIPPEGREDKNARLGAEEAVIESILSEKQAELATLSQSPEELGDQAARLDAAIREASEAVVVTKEQIGELEEQRATLFSERVELQSRLQFLEEQLKRFRLLESYYQSDRDRLEAVIEASRVVHELPEGSCPLCNRAFTEADELHGDAHAAFEAACVSEVDKIDRLRIDLRAAVADSAADEKASRDRSEQIVDQLRQVDTNLQRIVTPAVRTQQTELQSLIQQRTAIAQGETLRTTIRSLEERLEGVHKARTERPAKVSFENRATTSVAFEFCRVVEEILRAWKYPNLGTVSFDTDKADLVIGGQDRANKGKGYRAITYAAFVIGLMKYCRIKDIPHPGFVVLDTPVNPFKGPTSNNPDDSLSDDVKTAFFEYLANDTSGDQVIIMENEEPPASVRDRVNYYNFSKNETVGRYGFFPLRPS
jgi:hypothetical protein